METHLLQDLAIVMAVAAAATLVCYKLQQPVVIGYLFAGLLIGPFTPPFSLVHDLQSIHTLAELGLVFLLFCLGLEFNLPKIKKVGFSAGVAALLEVTGMLAIGYALGRFFGWTQMDSIFLGAILSISSTTIIVKVFMDFKMMNERFVQVVFGILVLEDIVAVAILSILSGLGAQGGPDTVAIFLSFAKIALFVILFLVFGLLLIPRFIHWVASFHSIEVLGLVILGLCFGGAMLAHTFQLSIALGAFLMGAILAASKEIHTIEKWIHPIRDMFSAIFFVSAGMLIQPALLWEHRIAILVVTLVTLVGKIISGAAGSFLVGYDLKTSARVGFSVAQIGEFSFVIASLGSTLNITSQFLYPLAIAVSSLTTLATPYLIRNSDHLVDGFIKAMPTSFTHKLNSYEKWIQQTLSLQNQSAGTVVISKYLIRFGIYSTIYCACILLVKTLGQTGMSMLISQGMWLITAVFCLPLFTIISKYANHVLLLLVTRNKHILHVLNISLFYKVTHQITMFFLSWLYLEFSGIESQLTLFLMAIGLFGVWKLFHKNMSTGTAWLEKHLDHITGLASAEPF